MKKFKDNRDLHLVQRAVENAGGFVLVRDAIYNELKISLTRQAIYKWGWANQVPEQYCYAVERATGVPREQLNPSVNWAYIKANNSAKRA